jgi:putative intracellular protease/amidase
VIQKYDGMVASQECKHPRAWTAPGFTLDGYDIVFLPGGHEKSVRQIIDSAAVQRLLADYYPKTKKPSNKAIGAVCHGVMVLSNAKGEDGKSVLHGCVTTALPARFEQLAYWGTRVFLGDYYKTYGAGSEDVEASVCSISPVFFPADPMVEVLTPLPT